MDASDCHLKKIYTCLPLVWHIEYMRCGLVTCSVVCQSFCLSVTCLCSAKMAEWIEGLQWRLLGPIAHNVRWGPSPLR